jgi:hypothetical protein
MIRDLDKRLRKLESRLPPEQSEEEEFKGALFLFQVAAIGYYLGDLKPNEPPMAGFSRALGYERSGDLQDAMKKNLPEFNQRYARAQRKLFTKFGVNLSTADGKEFSEALKRMHAGLPESRKERLAISS